MRMPLTLCKKGQLSLTLPVQSLVDNDALFDALETGVVKRYITDFGTEDLLNKPNVTVFPHVGGSTGEAELNCAIMAGQTIRRFMETGEIVNSVNFPRVQQALSAPYRITLINKNVPNIVARISTAVSDFNINIDNIINRSKGDYAYHTSCTLMKQTSLRLMNWLLSLKLVTISFVCV